MKKEIVAGLRKLFEEATHEEQGVEYWMARDIQGLLGYKKWSNFEKIIDKAKTACANSNIEISNHFADVGKMVQLGSDAVREINDIILTRYACYLIAQNGDPKKEPISFAQTYFAIQTRKQELLEERLELAERLMARKKLTGTEIELSELIYERGVDDRGFGRIRSKGDTSLFGGNTTQAMKKKLGVPAARPLADFLPTITIKAKDFATEITNFNVKKNDLYGENPITREHVKNNSEVRGLLVKQGIKPEELPPEEDIKKVERQLKKEEKKLLKNVDKLQIKNV